MRKSYVLLSFVLFIMLGGTLLLLGLKINSFSHYIDSPKWLTLHFYNLQQILKLKIKNGEIRGDNYQLFEIIFENQYKYKAVIKRIESTDIFWIDSYGEYQNNHQKYSQNKQFFIQLL